MDRQQYIAALAYCYKVEAAGAIAGEVAMLLREAPQERRKLDVFRRLEASNKILCAKALEQEGAERPKVETAFYRNGFKLGQKFGDGDWDAFLDRFEATIHPEVFLGYVQDSEGNDVRHEYDGVDVEFLKYLVYHELSLVEFIEAERHGDDQESTQAMERILGSDRCEGLIGPEDPVGW